MLYRIIKIRKKTYLFATDFKRLELKHWKPILIIKYSAFHLIGVLRRKRI